MWLHPLALAHAASTAPLVASSTVCSGANLMHCSVTSAALGINYGATCWGWQCCQPHLHACSRALQEGLLRASCVTALMASKEYPVQLTRHSTSNSTCYMVGAVTTCMRTLPLRQEAARGHHGDCCWQAVCWIAISTQKQATTGSGVVSLHNPPSSWPTVCGVSAHRTHNLPAHIHTKSLHPPQNWLGPLAAPDTTCIADDALPCHTSVTHSAVNLNKAAMPCSSLLHIGPYPAKLAAAGLQAAAGLGLRCQSPGSPAHSPPAPPGP